MEKPKGGDKNLSPEDRFTWTKYDDADKDELLSPAGLMEPVSL